MTARIWDLGFHRQSHISIRPTLDAFADESGPITQFLYVSPGLRSARSSLMTPQADILCDRPFETPINGGADDGHIKSRIAETIEVPKTIATGIFGKWHLGDIKSNASQGDQGFDESLFKPLRRNGTSRRL